MSDVLEIFNGQIWQQKGFPNFTIVVLMLGHVDGVAMFCKASWEGWRAPLVMTEEDGTWMYTKQQLVRQLIARKYEIIGCAGGGTMLGCEHTKGTLQ